MCVRGLISKFVVGAGRNGTDRQFFFVNGRPCSPSKVPFLMHVQEQFCILILYRFRRRSTKSTGRSTRRSLPLSSQTAFYLRVCLVC